MVIERRSWIPACINHIGRRSSAALGCVLALVIALVGCSEDTKIRVYQVSKADAGKDRSSSAAAQAKEQRMLAAIIPADNDAWFFKFRDVPEKVERHDHEFRQIVESFDVADGRPEWKLADGWTERKAQDGFTFVRLVNEDEGLEATVTRLTGAPSGDADAWQDYVQVNVNRWRRQLTLGEQEWDEMQADLEESPQLSTDSAKAYFVSLRGQLTGGGMRPPFASQAGPAAPAAGNETTAPNVPAKQKLSYTVPEDWQELDVSTSQFRLAAFRAGESEITVVAAGGDIETNMGMWMQQVAIEPTPEASQAILQAAEQLSVGDAQGKIYFIDGSEAEGNQSILIADVPWDNGQSLFIKLKGDAEQVQAQRDAFLEFVQSIK